VAVNHPPIQPQPAWPSQFNHQTSPSLPAHYLINAAGAVEESAEDVVKGGGCAGAGTFGGWRGGVGGLLFLIFILFYAMPLGACHVPLIAGGAQYPLSLLLLLYSCLRSLSAWRHCNRGISMLANLLFSLPDVGQMVRTPSAPYRIVVGTGITYSTCLWDKFLRLL